MNEPEALKAIADTTRLAWELEVGQYGRHAQWRPRLVVFDDMGVVEIVCIVPEGDDPVNMGTAVLEAASATVGTTTEWLAAVVDAYVSTDAALLQRVMDGSTCLSEAHAKGLPGVLDAMFVHSVNRKGAAHFEAMPYRIRRRRVQWLDLGLTQDDTLGEMGGRMAEGLRAIMTRAAN